MKLFEKYKNEKNKKNNNTCTFINEIPLRQNYIQEIKIN